ncbi:MAG TPA: hypothetical protein PLY23_08610 [Alphaproteobacteria bacterium]|nr:hypothetical protein [Alphaproteobacteria bacterium]HQS94708.1 hypothetical protein [Alphaproteobacteria bacterium]
MHNCSGGDPRTAEILKKYGTPVDGITELKFIRKGFSRNLVDKS